jgi:hypothetical protein
LLRLADGLVAFSSYRVLNAPRSSIGATPGGPSRGGLFESHPARQARRTVRRLEDPNGCRSGIVLFGHDRDQGQEHTVVAMTNHRPRSIARAIRGLVGDAMFLVGMVAAVLVLGPIYAVGSLLHRINPRTRAGRPVVTHEPAVQP